MRERRIIKVSGEKKDITIRRVDAELYDQFVYLAKSEGLSVGDFFNHLISGFFDPRFSPSCRHRMHHMALKDAEIIKDRDKLVIEGKDLDELDGKHPLILVNIDKVVFEEDVDGKDIANNIRLIKRCKEVIFKGDIPKLIKYGIIWERPSYAYPTDPEKLKDITIRNVFKELYENFLSKSKEEEKNIGEFFSEHLAFFIPVYDLFHNLKFLRNLRNPIIVTQKEKLNISKKDLADIGNRELILFAIDEIKFDANIPSELFLDTVKAIIKCNEVYLPKSIPKLLALARTKNCGKVITP